MNPAPVVGAGADRRRAINGVSKHFICGESPDSAPRPLRPPGPSADLRVSGTKEDEFAGTLLVRPEPPETTAAEDPTATLEPAGTVFQRARLLAMDDAVWRGLLDETANDPGARSARRELCRVLVTAFEEWGRLLRGVGHVCGSGRVDGSSPFGNGDDRLVAMGYLSATAGSLLGGMRALLDDENLYAGAALSRQLVEVEYLMWAFAEDQEEASSWLRSTPDERRER